MQLVDIWGKSGLVQAKRILQRTKSAESKRISGIVWGKSRYHMLPPSLRYWSLWSWGAMATTAHLEDEFGACASKWLLMLNMQLYSNWEQAID